jgi:hypothetical protein
MPAWGMIFTASAFLFIAACGNQPMSSNATPQEATQPTAPVETPSPTMTGGFDGARAYEHVRHLVELGPRPPGSDAIHRAQSYIIEQLKSYGCQVEEHDFHGSSSLGQIAMKNIVAKIPGKDPPIISPSLATFLSNRFQSSNGNFAEPFADHSLGRRGIIARGAIIPMVGSYTEV